MKGRNRWRDFVRWVVENGPLWRDKPPKGCDIPPSEWNALYIEAKLHRVDIYRRMLQGKRYTVYFTSSQEGIMMYHRRIGKNG